MTILDVGDDGARTPDGRPLSRAEIDLLVREAIRLEDDLDGLGEEGLEDLLARTPYQAAARAQHRARTTRPSRPLEGAGSRRYDWRWLALGLVSVAALLAVVLPAVYDEPVTTIATSPHRYADGHYEFMNVQPDGRDLPIGFNPCLRVPVWVNYAGATPDIRQRLGEALTEIDGATGMRLRYAGASQLRRTGAGNTGGIVVSFTDIASDHALDGAAAVGGSTWYPSGTPGSTSYYTGGAVTLNLNYFNAAGADEQRAILLHEIGHALGLAHSTGSREIMNATGIGTDHYQHGDLTGLAILGSLPCR